MLPAAVRGASREAGASLEQNSYYFFWKINVFFEHVLPAAMRSVSREAPLENKNKNKNKTKTKNKNKSKNKISSYKV